MYLAPKKETNRLLAYFFPKLPLASHKPPQSPTIMQQPKIPKSKHVSKERRKRRRRRMKKESLHPSLPLFPLEFSPLEPLESPSHTPGMQKEEEKQKHPRNPPTCTYIEAADTFQSVRRSCPCVLHKTYACTHSTMKITSVKCNISYVQHKTRHTLRLTPRNLEITKVQVLNVGFLVSNVRRKSTNV